MYNALQIKVVKDNLQLLLSLELSKHKRIARKINIIKNLHQGN